MAFCIKLELDRELPLMVWSDVVLLYLRDYVLTPGDRMVRATENRILYLVDRAIRDTRAALAWSDERVEAVRFRELVCDTLYREYGFLPIESARRTILREELEPYVSDDAIRPVSQTSKPYDRERMRPDAACAVQELWDARLKHRS